MIEKYIVKREETVRRIENIYADRRNFISSDCAIDSLARIDRKVYDCDNCILEDTINTVRREGDVRDVMCPMVMKRECKVLR